MISKEKRHPILRVLLIIVLALILVCLGVFGYSRVKFEQQIQNSNNPQEIVDAFLQALMTNNLRFAKKLVTSEQIKNLDQWKANMRHSAYDCPGSWSLDDILASTAWGVGGSGLIDENTMRVDSSYGCNNNNYSIRIEGVIVQYDGRNWRITHWDRICESSAEENSPRICYPND
ncbi:MAG: hypothetical protein U0Z26_17145 [Anaerolineales bacterium]